MNQPTHPEEEPLYLSPLKLIYSAYTNERPVVSDAILAWFQGLGPRLAPLTESDRDAVFQAVCGLCAEEECRAFLAGMRAGARIARELADPGCPK